MVDGEVWANIWQTQCIARICPATGQVTGWLLMHGLRDALLRRNLPMRGKEMDVLNGGFIWGGQLAGFWVCGGLNRVGGEVQKQTGATANHRPANKPHRSAAPLDHPGIAWDAARRRLFVTGKYWPRLFVITPKPVNATARVQQMVSSCFQTPFG
jgi:glutamine cyclotransferase